MKTKVEQVNSESIVFDNGIHLYSSHGQDCCETHYLDFSDLEFDDFNGLEFDLSNDDFFKRIDGYGIELMPLNGHSVKIPGYGYNNGYYSTEIELVLNDNKGFKKSYDVSECQVITE